MNTIIQQIVEKIIEIVEGNLEMVLKERKNVSYFIINLKKTLDEVGTDITSWVLEEINHRVKESTKRKQDWVFKSKDNAKRLSTIFGEVKYKRISEYRYLSDEILGIEVHDKMDSSLKSRLIEEAIDLTYRKSEVKASDNIELAGQAVMNTIRELGLVENNAIPIKEKIKI